MRASHRIGSIVTLLACALMASPLAAQNVARGQALYGQLGCGTSSCHGANPADNLRNVMSGAGSPSAIEYAATVRDAMAQLLATFQNDASAVVDLAAWLASIAAAPPTPQAPPVQTIVEFFHAGFGHYFVTNLGAEIAALDSGTFAGWARTGKRFDAYAAAGGAVAPVCRFFTTAFAPKSSHFYTPLASECDAVRGNQDWMYEGEAFFVAVPDSDGKCGAQLRPVYRLYNNGIGGAPNHRYTTDTAIRTQMRDAGWVSEGRGGDGVIFCVP